MVRLLPDDYRQALPVIQQGEIRTHLSCVYTLLEGRQEGKIFVDRHPHPRIALVCPGSGFWFLFGEAENDGFCQFLPELISKHLVDKCAVFATSTAWRRALDPLFAGSVARTGFAFRPGLPPRASDGRKKLPNGFSLKSMTEAAVQNWSPGVDPWVLQIWGGARGFSARSFGRCVTFEGQVVSIAAALAIGGGEVEIEVGTAPEFQGQGLAALCCRAFLDECPTRHLRPAWSCAAGNIPSAALGRKLGFVETEQIIGYPLEPSFRCVNGIWGPPALSGSAAGERT